MCDLRHGGRCPRVWLQVFLLEMLVSMCVAGNAPGECHPNTAGAALAAARPTEIAFKIARLPRHTADNMKSLNLLQATMTPTRKDNDAEEEPWEEPVVTKREEEEETPLEKIGEKNKVLRARLQLDRGLLLFENARFKLNHVSSHRVENKTSRGLQPVSQPQVSSRSADFDANRSTRLLPFSSDAVRLNMWGGLQHLNVSRHFIALQCAVFASTQAGHVATWLLFATLFLVVVLIVLYQGRRLTAQRVARDARAVSGNGIPHSKRPSKSNLASVPRTSNRSPSSPNATSPLGVPVSPPPELTSSLLLLQQHGFSSGETENCLCPDLVVPPACESILRVPINPKSSFHVTDMEDNAVLSVELESGQNIPYVKRRILLSSDGVTLGQCLPQKVHGSAVEFHLWRASGEYFAKLFQGGPAEPAQHSSSEATWTLQTYSGAEWFLRGSFDRYSVDVADTSGRLLAMSQQDEQTEGQHGDAAQSFFLRVAPHMDVSVVLFCLLAVNHLRP